MELVLNQKLKKVSEPIKGVHFTTNGLLNSNYKSLVKNNYKASTQKTVFGVKQRVKASQFNAVNHTMAIIKLSAFLIAVIAIF